jgi:hypothetical protein
MFDLERDPVVALSLMLVPPGFGFVFWPVKKVAAISVLPFDNTRNWLPRV